MELADLEFSFKEIASKEIGARMFYSFSEEVDFEDVVTTSEISGELEIMKLDGAFHVVVTNIEVEVELICPRSNRPYKREIEIEEVSRTFYLNTPEEVEDPFDIFYVDKKHLTLTIKEPLRQEIILHFPTKPVCLAGTEKECSLCGFDFSLLNEHNKGTLPSHKPLQGLKELFKN